MDAKQLFEAGKLSEAIAAQNEAVKSNPADVGGRTFLFELLCFSGNLERAERQLDVIGHQSADADVAAQAYRNILHAEQLRRRLHSDGLKPKFLLDPPHYVNKHLEAVNRLREDRPAEAKALLDESEAERPELAGKLDGTPFEGFRDCDDLLAPLLELLIGPDYHWLPLEQVQQLEIAAPKKPRDLLWSACQVTLTDGSPRRGYMPVLYCHSHEHPDDQVKLGRMTDWKASDDGPVLGVGQRLFLAGDDEHAVLELRTVVVRQYGS